MILADEPTGNLDSHTAEEVVRTLQTLSAEHGVTVIVVTHAAEVAELTARRVRLRDGRVVSDEGSREPALQSVPAPPVAAAGDGS